MALNQTNKTRVGCGDLCCFALRIHIQLVVNNNGEDIMRLTKEKLIALWRIRKQIFNNPINSSFAS